MDLELKKLEDELKGFSPSPLSGDVLSRMVEAMDRWEEADDEVLAESATQTSEGGNIISFPTELNEKSKSAGWYSMWSAAAAVAILGALIGLFVQDEDGVRVASLQNLGPVPLLQQASFVPVDVQRRVSSMDAGVIADKQGQAYQLIRVVRQEEANFTRADNVGMKITRPKVDYYVVPVSY